MKKILITGGTGFVGTHLKNLLQQTQPDTQLHLTSHRPRESTQNLFIHALDLSDSRAVEKLIADVQPDEIYHLASLASVAASFEQPATVLRNNFMLTLNLLEAVRIHSPASRLLVVSSADLYDHHDDTPIDEKHNMCIGNPYAASKATQDAMAQAYAKSFDLKIVIVRPFNHIGPGQKTGFVVADFASQVARAIDDPQARHLSVGNLASARDFTDVRDMVRAYALLMEKGQTGEIYNAGSGRAVKIQSILEQLIALSGVDIKVEIDQNKFRPVDAPTVVADNSKLYQLGWRAEIPLEQTLRDTLSNWCDIIRSRNETRKR